MKHKNLKPSKVLSSYLLKLVGRSVTAVISCQGSSSQGNQQDAPQLSKLNCDDPFQTGRSLQSAKATNSHRLQLGLLSLIATASVVVSSNPAIAATTMLNFNDASPTLVSGSPLSQGTVYRYKNVAANTDALVTIVQISNSQLVLLDDNNTFANRFQPTIRHIGSSTTSYIRFNFQLVISGTTTPTSVPNVYFSAQDVDGNSTANSVREFVELVSNNSINYVANPTLLANVTPLAGGVRYQQINSSNVQPGIGTDDRYEFYSYIGTSVSSFSVIGGSSTGTNTTCNTTNAGCDRQNSWTFDFNGVQPLDFGDVPANYGTAPHPIPPTPMVYFGATIDGDDAPKDSINADGDDLSGIDDEDGVASFPSLTTRSTSYSVTASCKGTNASSGAWIDFNRNGIFEGSERASGTCNNTSVTFNWTGLTGLSAGLTYARFRIATLAAGVNTPTSIASDGEVEDYPVNIQSLDFGDAPSLFGDAAHTIQSLPTLYLGSVQPDGEVITQLGGDAGATASGDDASGIDDEDAFSTVPSVPVTGSYSLSVPLTNASGSNATLHAWIDFNRNNKFESGEYQTAIVNNNATTANISWNVPSGAVSGKSYARFRLTTGTLTDDINTSGIDERATGNANDGEVEDYPATIDAIANNPNILLVKRITAVNSQATNPNDGTSLNVFINDGIANSADDNSNWPSNYLIGALTGGLVRPVSNTPADTVEYSIYFLSAGSAEAKNVLLCDRIPQYTTFLPDAYTSAPPADPLGTRPNLLGMALAFNGSEFSLTGAADGDAGYYFPTGTEPSSLFPGINCNGPNNNGAIVINLGNLPSATAQGQPTSAFGRLRFQVTIN